VVWRARVRCLAGGGASCAIEASALGMLRVSTVLGIGRVSGAGSLEYVVATNNARLAAASNTTPAKSGARDGRILVASSTGWSALRAAGTLLGREYMVVGASSANSVSSRWWTAGGGGVATIAADLRLGTGGGVVLAVVLATRGAADGAAKAVASVSIAPASAWSIAAGMVGFDARARAATGGRVGAAGGRVGAGGGRGGTVRGGITLASTAGVLVRVRDGGAGGVGAFAAEGLARGSGGGSCRWIPVEGDRLGIAQSGSHARVCQRHEVQLPNSTCEPADTHGNVRPTSRTGALTCGRRRARSDQEAVMCTR
jgi:hypothetical protein